MGTLTRAQTASNDQCSGLDWNWRSTEELGSKQNLSENQQFSSEERKALADALTRQLRAQNSSSSDEELRSLAMKSRVRYTDLNDDGKPEVIVQSADVTTCSPTGNCQFWVLRKVKNQYSVLLDETAQAFTVQPGSTNSFHDLVLTLHGSAFASDGKLLRFDGRGYTLVESFAIEWYSRDQEGAFDRRLPEPKITECESQE